MRWDAQLGGEYVNLEEKILLNALRESYLPLAGDMRPVREKAKAFTCTTDGHGRKRSILVLQLLMDFFFGLENPIESATTTIIGGYFAHRCRIEKTLRLDRRTEPIGAVRSLSDSAISH
jgi:hypothetical protein